MFGVGDLLLILLGGGTLATKSFKESEAKISSILISMKKYGIE